MPFKTGDHVTAKAMLSEDEVDDGDTAAEVEGTLTVRDLKLPKPYTQYMVGSTIVEPASIVKTKEKTNRRAPAAKLDKSFRYKGLL